MLRLTRLVQCSLVASSASFSMIPTVRGSSTGRNSNGNSSSSSSDARRRKGKDWGTPASSPTAKNGGGRKNGKTNAAVEFDFTSFGIEEDAGNHGPLLPPYNGVQLSTPRRSLLAGKGIASLPPKQALRVDAQREHGDRTKKRRHAVDASDVIAEEKTKERVKRTSAKMEMEEEEGHVEVAESASSTHADSANDDGGSATTLSNPFRGIHEHISRSYRLDQLLAVAQPEDMLLGRQETKTGAFSFIRFACTPRFLADHRASGRAESGSDLDGNNSALVVAQRLLDFPPHLRHFHTICGRDNVPCDFFADVDLPNESQASGEKTLLEMLNYLEVRLQGIGFLQPSFLVLTNEVPSPDKVSYHVHARSMGTASNLDNDGSDDAAMETDEAESISSDMQKTVKKKKSKKTKTSSSSKKIIAFQDYRVVKLLADEVNLTLGRTVIDEQCYRSNGMLRCAYSCKLASQSHSDASNSAKVARGKRLVPLLKAQDTALQRRLDEMSGYLHTLSEPEILERTFCTRFTLTTDTHRGGAGKDLTRRFKLLRQKHVLGPGGAQGTEFDAYGNPVSAYLTEGAKWRRFKLVIEKLRRMTPRSAESYDLWVRVGLALHNFSNEDHVFEEWVRFSLKCPQKYSRESCRKKWQQFERNPDALNWRRGFNYLNSTIWRSVHGD